MPETGSLTTAAKRQRGLALPFRKYWRIRSMAILGVPLAWLFWQRQSLFGWQGFELLWISAVSGMLAGTIVGTAWHAYDSGRRQDCEWRLIAGKLFGLALFAVFGALLVMGTQDRDAKIRRLQSIVLGENLSAWSRQRCSTPQGIDSVSVRQIREGLRKPKLYFPSHQTISREWIIKLVSTTGELDVEAVIFASHPDQLMLEVGHGYVMLNAPSLTASSNLVERYGTNCCCR